MNKTSCTWIFSNLYTRRDVKYNTVHTTNMELKKGALKHVSPFKMSPFSTSVLVFGGVRTSMRCTFEMLPELELTYH